MPPTAALITGPARSGKTWTLLHEYRAALMGRNVRGRGSFATGKRTIGVTSPVAKDSRPLPASLDAALWLAPTSRAATAVKQHLLDGTLAACLSPGVLTFDQLADRILSASRSPLRSLAPAAQRELLRRVVELALNHKRLEYYAQAARRASFLDLLIEHLRELKRRGISPADFVKAPPLGRSADAHRELARLYFDYEELLAAHALCDAEGRHGAARDALRVGSSWPTPLELIVVDGFTDFTATQLDILKHLAGRARRVQISLPNDPARPDLFAKSAATLSELCGVFPMLEVTELPPRPTGWPALDHLSTHLFRNPNQIPPFDGSSRAGSSARLSSPQASTPADPTGAEDRRARRLEIIAAAGEHDEIVQLARRIKQRLLPSRCPLPEGEGSKARPGDIVVVFRNLADAAPRIREVFTEFGIPFALESGAPLVRAPVLRTLLALLRLAADDWPFRRVVSGVTNNSLPALDGDGRAQADWLVRDLQVAGGRGALIERVEELAAEAEKQLESANNDLSFSSRGDHFQRRAQAAASAQPALRLLMEALDRLPKEASLGEWVTALEQLGGDLGLAPFKTYCATGSASAIHADPESVLESVNERGASPPEESAMLAQVIDGVAWQAIVRHFTSLEQLDERLDQPPRQLGLNDVLSLLVDLATHESLPRPHDDVGRVRVLQAVTARTVTAKHLYLAGMSEQAFPSPERAGRLYSEREYNTLSPAPSPSRGGRGEGVAPTPAHDEMLLFYEVLTRAEKTLTISYPALDAKAQALPPSPYVIEVERTVGRENVRRTEPELSPVRTDETPCSLSEWRVHAVAQALTENSLPLAGLAAHAKTQAVAAAIDAGLRTVHARSRRDRYSPFEGLLESAALRARLAERFGTAHLWSPSQWETYAACPYRFFLETVLGLEPLGELVLETDHARRGSLLHRVMATFHRELVAATGSDGGLSPHNREQLVARFAETLQNAVRGTSATGVDAALLELDRRQIEKWGQRYFDQLEKYNASWSSFAQPLTPAHFEVRFGPPRPGEKEDDPRSTDVPFVLDIGGEEIRIAGRIDRIDVGRVGEQPVFNVIDYKSGNRPTLNAEKIETGQRLQPALYVMAAEAVLFTEDPATPIWTGYWSMKNGVTTDGRFSLRCSADGAAESKDWESLRPKIKARIGQFVTDIRRGAFPVHSCDDHCTSHCNFNTVCRITQIRSLDKTWPDESGG